jgi:hypothetical protein
MISICPLIMTRSLHVDRLDTCQQSAFFSGGNLVLRGLDVSKNYFFKLDAADFLAEVVKAKDSGAWALAFALDLVANDSETATTEYAKKLIEEANGYRNAKVEAGRLGGLAKAGSDKVRYLKS